MPKTTWDRIRKFGNRLATNQHFATALLFLGVVVALIWANSPWADSYFHLWHTHFQIGTDVLTLDKDFHHWINDGLMSMFFFVVGLEIRKELISGELSTIRKAAVPMVAALGGMVFPALLYILFTYNTEYVHGWGIPMATDIAFALGAMAVVRKRFTSGLIVFLTALATVDDIGSVLVIAIFYTPAIQLDDLGIAFLFLAVMFAGNKIGIRSTAFYFVLGVLGVWLAITLSGIHATIAGVLAAFTIPANVKITRKAYSEGLQELTHRFEQAGVEQGPLISNKQLETIAKIKSLSKKAETPLQNLERLLKPVVQLAVIPLFAVANAGVKLDGFTFESLLNPIFLGVFTGLVIGKLLGIVFATWIAKRTRIGLPPAGASWLQISSVALVGGIGFTMSLFIAELALDSEEALSAAKLGILIGSGVAAVGGLVVARISSVFRSDEPVE